MCDFEHVGADRPFSAVDPVYSIALLHNNTVEIHSLATQVITQVVSLPTSSSPLALQPRSLLYSWPGLDLGYATGVYKTELVALPLLAPPPSSSVPSTPTKATHRASVSSASLRALDNRGTKGTSTRTFVVGKNSLYALTPLTLVVQADALIDKGRMDDALELVKQAERSVNPKANYVRTTSYVMDVAL